MEKRSLRMMCLLIAIITLLATVAGCKTDKKNQTDTGTAAETDTSASDSLYDEEGFLKDDLPETFDTDLDKVRILYWSDAENKEYSVDSLSGSDIINNALYTRNDTVADRMGVELEFVPCKGNYNAASTFTTTLFNAISAGDCYDLVSAYSMTMAICARDGMLADMNDTYVDLEKPWWPNSLTQSCQIGNALYFASGDASINTLYMMYCCYFNKELLEAYHEDVDLYDIVDNGEWTYEKMLTLMTDVYADGGVEGKDADADTFGMIGCTLYNNAMIEAFGFDEIVNSNGELTLSADWDSSRVESAITMIQNMFNTDYAISAETANVRDGFNTGRSLFAILYADQAAKRFSKNQALSYGVVPLPMLDGEQEGYITPVANPASFYGISTNTKDLMFASAVLECWASEGYRQVSPSLFEKCFKLRYSADDDNAKMYDYIRDGMKFNMARLFVLASNKSIQSFTLAPTIDGSAVNWLTLTESKKTSMSSAIRELNVFFKNLQ